MTRFFSFALCRAGLPVSMLVAFALAFSSIANAMVVVDHAEGERHAHAGLTTAAVDDHGDAVETTGASDATDTGSTKPGQAHHHHVESGAGLAVGTAVLAPTEPGRGRLLPIADARLADAEVKGLKRPPRAGFATT